jgi:hypothetical protein
MPDFFSEPRKPADGDEQPKGGTNRLSGMTGVMLLIGAFFCLLLVAGLLVMALSGKARP